MATKKPAKRIKMKHWDDITQRERITRWEHVVKVLKNLTPHERRRHWDMGTWGEKTDCGTVACAAGHCAMNPWFKRHGLKSEWAKYKNWHTREMETVLEIPKLHQFFGDWGVEEIFYNIEHRPVGQVIREVKAHIKALRNGEHVEGEHFEGDEDYV